jgi:hypothetical protein
VALFGGSEPEGLTRSSPNPQARHGRGVLAEVINKHAGLRFIHAHGLKHLVQFHRRRKRGGEGAAGSLRFNRCGPGRVIKPGLVPARGESARVIIFPAEDGTVGDGSIGGHPGAVAGENLLAAVGEGELSLEQQFKRAIDVYAMDAAVPGRVVEAFPQQNPYGVPARLKLVRDVVGGVTDRFFVD